MDKRIIAALISSIALLSGCAADEGIPAQSAESTPAATSELQSDSPVESTADSVSVEVPSADSREPVPTTEESAADSAEPTREPAPVTVESVEAALTESEPQHEVTTTTAVTTTSATAQTTAPEPVNVVIPEVRVPLSPGRTPPATTRCWWITATPARGTYPSAGTRAESA